MAARIQGKILGLGKAKQADIATASASFLRFKQLNSDLTSTGFTTENDAAEIGKGDEFVSAAGVFPVAYTPAARIDKYASAEFMTWALCYTFGNVTEASSIYTIIPIDAGTTLELPYFTVVEQVPEGGGNAVDNAYIGCAIEDFLYEFSYGPGRASGKVTVNWVGAGKITSPSTVTVPAVQAENYMLTASMALTINGTNYVSGKTILSGSFAWKNNLLLNQGFFPGSGTQNGAAIRGRIEIGAREPSFQFSARLLATSDEYTKLIAQTTGTAVLTVTFDSTHTVTLTLQSISYEVVENGNADGLIAVTVTCAVKKHATNGVVTAVCKCGVSGIAQ
jgi:hypothetical protein